MVPHLSTPNFEPKPPPMYWQSTWILFCSTPAASPSPRSAYLETFWVDGQTYVSPTCELDVFDRVGGGDGFASGFFYGLLSGASPDESVRLGWAHGALLTTFPGDTTMASLEQVRTFARGGSARIQR